MEREYGDGYMMDPTETAERIVRVIALHDHCKDPASITLAHTFEELGLNPLDMCEIHMAVEKEFDFEMAEDIVETWTTVNDFVEHVARDFYAKWSWMNFVFVFKLKDITWIKTKTLFKL